MTAISLPHTRRDFLALIGVGVSAIGLAGVIRPESSLWAELPRLDLLDVAEATFRPYIGDSFLISAPAQTVRLMEVASRGHRAFSLVFSGAADTALRSGTYPFVHDALGSFDLFVNPGIAGTSTIGYEAAFNHGDR